MSFDGIVIVGLVEANSAPIPDGGQHITLCWLGDANNVSDVDIEAIHEVVGGLASVVPQFEVDVAGREIFGKDDTEQADVLVLSQKRLTILRDLLLADQSIANLMAQTEQFPEYRPHMTLGYVGIDGYEVEPCSETSLTVIGLGLWIRGEHHDYLFSSPDSVLEDDDDEAVDTMELSTMQASAGEWAEHLHPRGKDGRFIEKYGIIKFLDSLTGMWSYGRVVGIADDSGKAVITVRPSDLSGNSVQGKKDIDLPTSKIYAAPKIKAHIQKSGMKKVGAQAGSNEGGLYEVTAVELKPGENPISALVGKKFYVKKAQTKAHGQNEALANALYEEAGVYVPEVTYDPDDGNLYSMIVKGEHDMSTKMKNPEWAKKVQANFVVDAWLANRDVFGLTWDNILTDESGEPVRIDNGGALLFRAMGAKKTDFGSKVTELDVFRQGKKAAIYGTSMDKSSELDGAQRVLAISPEKIEEMVAQSGLPKSLAATLKARRAYIADYYGLPLPESIQPSGTDHITAAPLVDPLDSSKSSGMPRTWSKTYDSLFSLSAAIEPGDEIKNATGIHTVGIEGDQQLFTNEHLAMLQAQGGPFQLKKMKVGPRVSQATFSTAPSSAAALLELEWQRGDRVTVNGVLLDVLGVNRSTGTMLVSPVPVNGNASSPAFPLNIYNLPGDSIETLPWDPPAALDALPAPHEKDGMAAVIAEQVKADLMEPLPDSGPPVTPVAAAEPGAGLGTPTKSDVKSMPLGDGTVAATGDKVTSKVDGKTYTFVKPKGAFAVVTDETGKQFMKKASTMTQPGKEPVLVPGLDTPAPVTKDGSEPKLGMKVTAPDGKSGVIMNISPDGKSVFFKDQTGTKVKKSTAVVTVSADADAPAPQEEVKAGTPSAGTPGLEGVNYATMDKPTKDTLKSFPYFTLDKLVLGETLVFTKHADDKVYVEKWANQPVASLAWHPSMPQIIVYSAELDTTPVMMKAKDFPNLSSDWASYEVQVGGKVLIVSPDQLGKDMMSGYDKYTNSWRSFPSDSVVLVSASNFPGKPVGSVIPAVLDTGVSFPYEAKPLGKLIVDGDLSVGSKVSADGKVWWNVTEATTGNDSSYIVHLLSEDGNSDYSILTGSHVSFVVDNSAVSVTSAVDTPEVSIPDEVAPALNPESPDVPAVTQKAWDDMATGDVVQVGKESYVVLYNSGADLGLLSKKGKTSKVWLTTALATSTDAVAGNLSTGVEVTPEQAAVLLEGKVGHFHFAALSGSGDTQIQAYIKDLNGKGHLIVGEDKVYDLGDFSDYGGNIVLTITDDLPADLPEGAAVLKANILGQPEPVTEADTASGPFSSQVLKQVLGTSTITSTPTPIFYSKKSKAYYRRGPDGKPQVWSADAKTWEDAPDVSLASMNKAVDAAPASFTFKTFSWSKDDTYITPTNGAKVFTLDMADADMSGKDTPGASILSIGAMSEDGPFYLFNDDGTLKTEAPLSLTDLAKQKIVKVYDPWEVKEPAPTVMDVAAAPTLDCGSGKYTVQPGEKVVEVTYPSSPGLSLYIVKGAPGAGGGNNDWWLLESNGEFGSTWYSDSQIDTMIANSDNMSVAKVIYGGQGDHTTATEAASEPPVFGYYTVPEGSSVYAADSFYYVKEPGSNVWKAYTDSGWQMKSLTVYGDEAFAKVDDAPVHMYGPKLGGGNEAAVPETFNGVTPQQGDQILKLKQTFGTGFAYYIKYDGKPDWYMINADGTVDTSPHADSVVQIKINKGKGEIVFGGASAAPAADTFKDYKANPGDVVVFHKPTTSYYVKPAGDSKWHKVVSGGQLDSYALDEGSITPGLKAGFAEYVFGSGPGAKTYSGYAPSEGEQVIHYTLSNTYYVKAAGETGDIWHKVMPSDGKLSKVDASGLSHDFNKGLATLVFGKEEDLAPKSGQVFDGYTAQEGDVVVQHGSTYYVKSKGDTTFSKISGFAGKTGSYPESLFGSSDYKYILGDPGTGAASPTPASVGPIYISPGMTLIDADGNALSSDYIDTISKYADKNSGQLPAGTKLYKTKYGDTYAEFPDGTGYAFDTYGLSWGLDSFDIDYAKKYSGLIEVYLHSAQPAPLTMPYGSTGVTTATGEYLPGDSEMVEVQSYAELTPGTIVFNTYSGGYIQIDHVDEANCKVYYGNAWNSDGSESGGYDDWLYVANTADYFKIGKGSVSTAPVATPAAPTAPSAPSAPDGVTKPDAAAIASWGGDLTKDGYIPYAGMNVVGKGPMMGKVISVSADKTKATVLTSDGKKTTRLIKALGSNLSANYAEKLGPVVPKEIPEGMTLPVPTPKNAFASAFAKLGSMFALVNGHKGVRNGETFVMGATAPSGKKYARVTFSLTKEQRALLKQMLESGPSAPAAPKKMGAWVKGSGVQSDSVAVGMNLAMRPSTSPPGKWKVDPNGDKPTHVVTNVGPWDNGRAEITLKNLETGEEIISGFHGGHPLQPYDWDPNKPAPMPKPVSGSNSVKLSAQAQAMGWTLLDGSDGVTAGIGGGVGGMIHVEPGSSIPQNKSAYISLDSGSFSPRKNAVRMKMADGTVIEVTNIGEGDNSYHGVVTVSIPEGGDSVSAYSAALGALGMDHAPHTQESTKEKARPLLRMLAFGGHTDLDTAGGHTDEEIFAKLGKTMGISDLGWQDVQIGVDESVGKVSYFWSDRAKNAIASKAKTNMIIRAASNGNASAIVSTIKGGTANAITKRLTGMVDPSTGKGLGASPESDAGNNAGHGGFMSAKSITGTMPTSNSLASYKGSSMMVYQRMDSVLSRIADFRLDTSNDAFGKGSSNNLEAMMSSSVKDFWVGGGVPAEAISYIAVDSASSRSDALKQLHSEGITHVGGRPIEEIVVLQTDIAKMTASTFPPFTYQPQTVPVLDLP